MGFALIATKTISGNTPKTTSTVEKAGQTFYAGVPVQLNGGYVQEWDGATIAAGILGVSAQFGSNLGSNGAGAPAAMQPYTGVGSSLTYGNVPNQTAAKKFARGGPVVDGRCAYFLANEDTTFWAAVGSAQTTAVTDVGTNYGMTKDSDGQWYVDRTKTGGSAVCKIIALEPLDGPKQGGRVLIRFLAASCQLAN